jgi:hypothetical protein
MITYVLIGLALFNVAVVLLGHRAAKVRKRMPSDAYFLPRQEPVPYMAAWDADVVRQMAARNVK